jgi:hypothetical protein
MKILKLFHMIFQIVRILGTDKERQTPKIEGKFEMPKWHIIDGEEMPWIISPNNRL